MALIYLKESDEVGPKVHVSKGTVRKIVESKDAKIEELYLSARHRFVKMHEGFSKIEKLEEDLRVAEQERKAAWVLTGVLIGYNILFTVFWAASGHAY